MNYWSNKIQTQFEDIKDNDLFQEKVGLLRVLYKIPIGGFDNEDLPHEADLYFELWEEIKNLLKTLKLPDHLRAIVTQYVIRGIDYNRLEPQVKENWETYCNLDYYPKSGEIQIVMKSGVKTSDVTKLMKKEMPNIKAFFDKYGQNPRPHGIKRKPTKSRNRQLDILLTNKILKKDGHFNIKKLKEYFIEQGVYSPKKKDKEMFREIGIDIPNNSNTVKMAIQRFQKIKKAK